MGVWKMRLRKLTGYQRVQQGQRTVIDRPFIPLDYRLISSPVSRICFHFRKEGSEEPSACHRTLSKDGTACPNSFVLAIGGGNSQGNASPAQGKQRA